MNYNHICYLIKSYLIIQDEEIHSNEILRQKELFPEISPDIIQKSKDILSDSINKISLDDLLNLAVSHDQSTKDLLISNLVKMAIADKYYHPKEEEFIKYVAERIDFNQEKLLTLILNLRDELDEKYKERVQTFYASVKEGFSSVFYKITGNEMFEGDLLEGKEFVNRIRQIAAKSHNDLELATHNMQGLNEVLEKNYTKFEILTKKIKQDKRADKESDSLVGFVDNLSNKTMAMLQNSIATNIKVLNKKKYNVDYFTIAFLGRTKAGKSTFHKVITGEETDDIGVGKLRTTRFNRVFNWENIRIIDTPGIGAPGGQTDTETARSIIDEADLVCYVVTNDAIQETEFHFLSELKEKNKPLFIILNCKDNLEQSIRLKKFLKDPLAWKENKGDKSIEGHIVRIKEMISKNYDPNLIEVIPIHLLSAKLAKDSTKNFSVSECKLLLQGSNIAEYNKKIKQTIFRNGHLKKTQNIIDGCRHEVGIVAKQTRTDLEEINNLIKNLESQKKALNIFIDDRQTIYKSKLVNIVESTHKNMSSRLRYFAENNYENKDISDAWTKFVDQQSFYQNMQGLVEKEVGDFQNEISEKMDESISDIKMNFNSFKVSKISVDINDYKFYGNMTLGVASIGITFIALLNSWNPGGWLLGGIFIAGLLNNSIFANKETKKKKAIDKITSSIKEGIIEQEKKISSNLISTFETTSNSLNKTICGSFDKLIEGSKEVANVLQEINGVAKEKEILLNKIFTYRILEHIKKLKENAILTVQIVNDEMKNIEIERSKENIEIKSKFKISPDEEKELTNALQLNIKFTN